MRGPFGAVHVSKDKLMITGTEDGKHNPCPLNFRFIATPFLNEKVSVLLGGRNPHGQQHVSCGAHMSMPPDTPSNRLSNSSCDARTGNVQWCVFGQVAPIWEIMSTSYERFIP